MRHLISLNWQSLLHRSCRFPISPNPFEVVADASGFAAGAVLLQEGRTIAFEPRVLSPAERYYPVGEQELLAVVRAYELGGVILRV